MSGNLVGMIDFTILFVSFCHAVILMLRKQGISLPKISTIQLKIICQLVFYFPNSEMICN